MRRSVVTAALAAVSALGFLSCVSTPPSRVVPGAFSRVGEGAGVYAVLDVVAARPIIETLAREAKVPEKDLANLFRSRSVEFGLFPGVPKWRAVATGDFPRNRAALSFALSPSWRRVGGSHPYWKATNGLSLAFDADGAALLSDGDPWVGGGAPPIPDAYRSFPTDAALRGWIPDPAERLSAGLGPAGAALRLPVTDFAFAIIKSGEGFRLRAVAVAPGEREARALEAMLRLIRNLGVQEGPAALLTELQVLREGASLALESRVLKVEETAGILLGLLPPALYFSGR